MSWDGMSLVSLRYGREGFDEMGFGCGEIGLGMNGGGGFSGLGLGGLVDEVLDSVI